MTDLREAAMMALEALDKLWQIIDDIDTYGDMAKADDKLYRSLVERKQRTRFEETGISTDGYTLNGGAITALRAALAQQDELVQEPVAWYQKRGQEVLTSHPACWGREDEPWTPLYTAPPQLQPETLDEAMRLPRAMAQAYENGYKAGVAAERERCLRLIDDHVRAVDSEDVVRAIKEVQG